ncbi:unnamed protein product, partial [Rotaria sp. Silwood1]
INLEVFENELLLYLFEFINPLDLFRELKIVCQNYIPLIYDKIIYLHLSDDDGTPGQAADFFNYNINLDQFTSLKVLTLFRIELHQKIDEFFSFGIQQLQHLIHLKFVDCCLNSDDVKKATQMMNQIWSLPKLIYCYWDVKPNGDVYFVLPTVISSSLQHLYIRNPEWTSKQLTHLMMKTPYLQYFSTTFIDFTSNFDNDNENKTLPSLGNLPMKKLKLNNVWSRNILVNLLYMMPNLYYLNIRAWTFYINGHEWKEIIVKYLPNLKIFRLNILFNLNNNITNVKKQINKLLDAYRSPFWIEEHQWFIGCLWTEPNDDKLICLYSLPFSFEQVPQNVLQGNYRTKSTCPSRINFSYDHVHCLWYNSSLFTNTEFSRVQFNYMKDLELELPFDYKVLSIISNFNHLLSLTLSHLNHYPLQLQSLFDKMPRLLSLKFRSWFIEEMPPFDIKCPSVRYLDLQGVNKFRRTHCFNIQQCEMLNKSPLGMQCEELRIEVTDIQSILELVYMMKNLRTLYITYFHDSRSHQPDAVNVIQHHAPPTTIVTRKTYRFITIRL